MHDVCKRALGEAGLDLDDVRWVLAPHYGLQQLHSQIGQVLDLNEDRTLARPLGLRVGHMGPVDQGMALDYMLRCPDRLVDAGDNVLLLGVGVGKTYTAAVVRVERTLPGIDSDAFAVLAGRTPGAVA